MLDPTMLLLSLLSISIPISHPHHQSQSQSLDNKRSHKVVKINSHVKGFSFVSPWCLQQMDLSQTSEFFITGLFYYRSALGEVWESNSC